MDGKKMNKDILKVGFRKIRKPIIMSLKWSIEWKYSLRTIEQLKYC